MLKKYDETSPAGRPRQKLYISKNDQAVVYDFLVYDITATQAAKSLDMPIASFRHFVSYVIQYWIDIGLMGFTKDIHSIDNFEEITVKK